MPCISKNRDLENIKIDRVSRGTFNNNKAQSYPDSHLLGGIASVRPIGPIGGLDAPQHMINQIVKQDVKKIPHVNLSCLPNGFVAAGSPETATIDSGACDSIAPPQAFKNSKTIKTNEFGKTYGACGGETVTNVGYKKVSCLCDKTGKPENLISK